MQPHVEYEDVVWSPQYNMFVKNCSYKNRPVKFHLSLRVESLSICFLATSCVPELVIYQTPLGCPSPPYPSFVSSPSPHTSTLRSALDWFVLVAIRTRRIGGFRFDLLHTSRGLMGMQASRGLDYHEPKCLITNARIETGNWIHEFPKSSLSCLGWNLELS